MARILCLSATAFHTPNLQHKLIYQNYTLVTVRLNHPPEERVETERDSVLRLPGAPALKPIWGSQDTKKNNPQQRRLPPRTATKKQPHTSRKKNTTNKLPSQKWCVARHQLVRRHTRRRPHNTGNTAAGTRRASQQFPSRTDSRSPHNRHAFLALRSMQSGWQMSDTQDLHPTTFTHTLPRWWWWW